MQLVPADYIAFDDVGLYVDSAFHHVRLTSPLEPTAFGALVTSDLLLFRRAGLPCDGSVRIAAPDQLCIDVFFDPTKTVDPTLRHGPAMNMTQGRVTGAIGVYAFKTIIDFADQPAVRIYELTKLRADSA